MKTTDVILWPHFLQPGWQSGMAARVRSSIAERQKAMSKWRLQPRRLYKTPAQIILAPSHCRYDGLSARDPRPLCSWEIWQAKCLHRPPPPPHQPPIRLPFLKNGPIPRRLHNIRSTLFWTQPNIDDSPS